MRPSSSLTASLLLLAGLVACDTDRKPVDETANIEPVGFACVDDFDEVADDPLNPTPPPFCRIGVLGSLQLDGRPLRTVAVIDRGAECNRTEAGDAINIAPGVAARFHAAFQLDPDFVPIDDSPACPAAIGSGPIVPLPAGASAALEFTTTGPIPVPSRGGRHSAAARGRRCKTGRRRLRSLAVARQLPHRHRRTRRGRGFPELSNLRQVLSDEALRCARGFAATLGAPAPL